MATHSSILAWRIPWTKEPGGLPNLRVSVLATCNLDPAPDRVVTMTEERENSELNLAFALVPPFQAPPPT